MSTTSRQSPATATDTSESSVEGTLRKIFDLALIAAMIAAPFLLVRSHDSDADKLAAAQSVYLAQVAAP